MIRKAIIVILTLGSVTAAGLAWRSYSTVFMKEVRITQQDLLFFHFNDGFARLMWLRSEQDFSIVVEPGFASDHRLDGPPASLAKKSADYRLSVHTSTGCSYPVSQLVSAAFLRRRGLPTHQVAWFHKWTSAKGCPPLYRGFSRTRSWTICVVLAAYPTIAFIRGPLRRWRRRRKGLCFKCGYDLMGNVSGVCPECGEAAW